MAGAPIEGSGPPTTFRATGSIDRVNRAGSSISFFSDAPFWGPARYGYGRVGLWPKDTALELHVAGPTPITIDGKRASFRDLTVGQKVVVQYNMAEGGVSCIADRIDARASNNSEKVSVARLVGHWRNVGPGYIYDFWFAANGSFKSQVAQAGRALREYSGRWSLVGSNIDYQITKSTFEALRAGKTDRDKVLGIGKDYYLTEDLRGDQHRYYRLEF